VITTLMFSGWGYFLARQGIETSLTQAVEILLRRRDTASKTGPKCSFITHKLRFFAGFCLVSRTLGRTRQPAKPEQGGDRKAV
jgi:hypothetical protein